MSKFNIGNLFLITALGMLVLGMFFGILAASVYIFPDFTVEKIAEVFSFSEL